MSLKDKNIVVTGGSRGLGLGLVEALVAHGARVTVVARDTVALESVRARLGVAAISADGTDETAAHRILGEEQPDALALNAGTKPPMGPSPRSARRCRPGSSARRWFPCWTPQNMPRASPSGSRAIRELQGSRERRLERRTCLAERRPPGGAPRPGRCAAARTAPLLRASHGIGHRRRGRRAGHARPGFPGVSGLLV